MKLTTVGGNETEPESIQICRRPGRVADDVRVSDSNQFAFVLRLRRSRNCSPPTEIPLMFNFGQSHNVISDDSGVD